MHANFELLVEQHGYDSFVLQSCQNTSYILYRPFCDLVVQANWRAYVYWEADLRIWLLLIMKNKLLYTHVFLWMSRKISSRASLLPVFCLKLCFSELCVWWSDGDVTKEQNEFQNIASFSKMYWCTVYLALVMVALQKHYVFVHCFMCTCLCGTSTVTSDWTKG